MKSEVEKAFAAYGYKRQVSLVAPTTSMLSEFILGTDMIATMPKTLARTSYRLLAHCPPPIELPRLTYDLVWHRRSENSGRCAWMRRLITDIRADLDKM